MKNFNLFVEHIVSTWRTEKEIILAREGLHVPSNREEGDLSERYVVSRIDKISPNYTSIISKGSQSPSDIYSVARRKNYWHIMLIQVKSSRFKNSIYKLDNKDIIKFEALAKFIKEEIPKSLILENYRKKPIVISIGYAGIYSNHEVNPTRHYLIETECFKMYRLNSSGLDLSSVKKSVLLSHEL